MDKIRYATKDKLKSWGFFFTSFPYRSKISWYIETNYVPTCEIGIHELAYLMQYFKV